MIYVFDSDTLIDLFRHYYLERFPTLWQNFDNLVSNSKIISVSEVGKELEDYEDRLSEWVKNHREFFHTPTSAEFDFVADIFKIAHFQTMVRKKERLQGKPVADPFVIAKAKISEGWVVTQEKLKENAAQIPNVCKHFGIPCINLEEFMEKEGWQF
jgi:hypothetical protein